MISKNVPYLTKLHTMEGMRKVLPRAEGKREVKRNCSEYPQMSNLVDKVFDSVLQVC